MKILNFEEKDPSGKILIDLREYGILRWYDYTKNFSFSTVELYNDFLEEKISLNNDDSDKLLLIVSDSKYPKHIYCRLLSISELKNL